MRLIVPAPAVLLTSGQAPTGHRLAIMSSREAAVLPGGANGPHAPLLMYAADAAETRGALIKPVYWQNQGELNTLPADQWGPWIKAQVDAAVSAEALLIGKSLGTTGLQSRQSAICRPSG
jgi:hypothetical protein